MPLIQLASNENPLGPSPLAIAAARDALASANRYPDDNSSALRDALAHLHSVPPENILLGNGSTELIDLAARTVLSPGDVAVVSHGTFPLYAIAVRSARAESIEIPSRDFAPDLEALARAVTPSTKLIYLANPNNPTGTIFSAAALARFLDDIPKTILVVLDEAYCDYVARSDYPRSLDLLRGGRNLLVLRTFSKIHGLAGLRIGYGLAPAALVRAMNAIRMIYNTSRVAHAAALAALGDSDHLRRSLETNRAGQHQLCAGLATLGAIPFVPDHDTASVSAWACAGPIRMVPSSANFIFLDFGYDTRPLCADLADRGVQVRPTEWMGYPHGLRVSIGAAADNDAFLGALAAAMAAGHSARPAKL
ncbi:MAG: histidinol-phosphate transaminase [Candidatus Acidiferrales bacterium]